MNISAQIDALRRELGGRATIMGHHYQSDSVMEHVDLRGDSLELARRCTRVDSEHIVFCGVYFMAESAAVLAKPGQNVYLPHPGANCVMAQMAPAGLARQVLKLLSMGGRRVVPLTYVKSSLAIKAVVGEYGGSVCTSSNALKMLEWAFGQGDAVLFLPDKNLGRNTARQMGLPERDMHILDIRRGGAGLDPQAAAKARLLLWPGLCAIHARFGVKQIEDLRKAHPGARVLVHPECGPEVVQASDAAGSTSFLIRSVEQAPAGSTLAIGTEINLVRRLANEHKGRVTVLPLTLSACSHMAKTTPELLLRCLRHVADLEKKVAPETLITADPNLAVPAREALDRMLQVCS